MRKMLKSRYFSLAELLHSTTAVSKKIENLPSWEVIENLNRLALFLDEMREAWGSGLRITSGYRNLQLNSAVGGVSGSAHCTGNAVDIVPVNGRMNEFETFLKRWLVDREFDECIWEYSKSSGSRWVHCSLFSNKGLQRRKMFGLQAK